MATHRPTAAETWEARAPAPVVIVEGILVLSVEALRNRLQLGVYVDAPSDVRLIRRLRRDLDERQREVDEVLEQYTITVRPMHTKFVEPSRRHADLVVDGTRPIPELREAVLERLDLNSSEDP